MCHRFLGLGTQLMAKSLQRALSLLIVSFYEVFHSQYLWLLMVAVRVTV